MNYAINYLPLILIVFAGCAAVGPDYVEPDIAVPDRWHERIAEQVSQGPEAPLEKWWTTFNDPVLDDLIARASTANLDLKTAASRIREARAQLVMAGSTRFPVVDASGKASQTLQSDDGVLKSLAPTGGFDPQDTYSLGVDASWELDIFGRIRRIIESAEAQYQATVEAERDVRVTLFAEVALTYTDLRAAQNRIVYSRRNVASQREVLALAKERFETGLSSKLDMVQARANLGSSLAMIPDLVTSRNQALNRLAVLLGTEAGTLKAEFEVTQPVPKPGDRIAVGVPADLLRQRPDIRGAERLLAAQTALIGVATADLYPDFSLTGFVGLESRSLNDLFDTHSKMWGLSIPVNWSLFNGGRVRANILVQEERAEQALLAYRQTILKALAEVVSAMEAFNQEQIRYEALQGAVDATDEAVELVLVRYNTGLTDFNNVMMMQRDLLELQDQWVSSKARLVIDLIVLYKAMGGGW
jgi:multidrug efflux system outer membrane protein